MWDIISICVDKAIIEGIEVILYTTLCKLNNSTKYISYHSNAETNSLATVWVCWGFTSLHFMIKRDAEDKVSYGHLNSVRENITVGHTYSHSNFLSGYDNCDYFFPNILNKMLYNISASKYSGNWRPKCSPYIDCLYLLRVYRYCYRIKFVHSHRTIEISLSLLFICMCSEGSPSDDIWAKLDGDVVRRSCYIHWPNACRQWSRQTAVILKCNCCIRLAIDIRTYLSNLAYNILILSH